MKRKEDHQSLWEDQGSWHREKGITKNKKKIPLPLMPIQENKGQLPKFWRDIIIKAAS